MVLHLFLYILFLNYSLCKNVLLNQNGFEGVTIYISPSVPESKWNELLEKVEEVFAEGSTYLYYGSNSRAYFRDIEIVLPMSVKKYGNQRTFSSMMADITVENSPSSLYSKMPYNEQARICHVEGDRINFPVSFFESLENTMDRIGVIGPLIVKQWMGYRYGIFEEVGFPLDPVYPAVYCKNDILAATSCTNVPLNNTGFTSIRGNDDDCLCNPQGSLDHCMYVLGPDQDDFLLSSLMSFSQIPTNTVFCDSEYFDHDPNPPTIHNAICNKQPTFDVVLQHSDYEFGHNGPNHVPDTAPTYHVSQQALRVQIVIDTIQEVNFGTHIAQILQDWIGQEQNKGVDFGKHMIVSGGKYWQTEKVPFDDLTKIFGPTSSAGSFSNLEWAMDKAIEELDPNFSIDFPSYIILISTGHQTMGDMLNAFSNSYPNQVHVLAIDTNDRSSDSMEAVSKVSTGGFYVHAGSNSLEVSKALRAFTSTLSFNAESDMTMIYEAHLSKREPSVSFPVDSSIKTVYLRVFFKSPISSEVSITVSKSGKSDVITSSRSNIVVESFDVGDADGTWTLFINSSTEVEAGIQVLGEIKANEDWIRLECEVRKTLVNRDNTGARILAKVFSEGDPIVKASVLAVMNGQEIKLEDTGSIDGGPDSIADDGVYTAFLPDIDDEPVSVECRMKTDSASFSHPGFETDNNGFAGNLKQPFCCGSRAPEPKTPGEADNISRISQSAFYKP